LAEVTLLIVHGEVELVQLPEIPTRPQPPLAAAVQVLLLLYGTGFGAQENVPLPWICVVIPVLAKVAVTFLFEVTLFSVQVEVELVQSPEKPTTTQPPAVFGVAVQVLLPPVDTGLLQLTEPPAAGLGVAVTVYVHPLLIVVLRLETGGPEGWSANASPLKEFPVNACAAHVLSPQERGSVAL
jgi:hypothetical protein